jgi:GT2 family glycosyltransferase
MKPAAKRSESVGVSIVSHGHGAMVIRLLEQMGVCPEVGHVFLTLNCPEETRFPEIERVTLIHNPRPKGFGGNHNAAFQQNTLPFFCVLNPDVTLLDDPFPVLLEALEDPGIGVAAPRIFSPQGEIEDNARDFPTVARILRRVAGRGVELAPSGDAPWFPDWVAGTFMLFRAETYTAIGGFDPSYYLYYEDVDLCLRLRRQGQKSALISSARVLHDARRSSHRNLRHFSWHLASMSRYLWQNKKFASVRAFSISRSEER